MDSSAHRFITRNEGVPRFESGRRLIGSLRAFLLCWNAGTLGARCQLDGRRVPPVDQTGSSAAADGRRLERAHRRA